MVEGDRAADLQETLLRAWRSWPRLAGYDDPQRWSRRVLHNLAISRWRRKRVRRLYRFVVPTEVAGPDAAHIYVVNALHRLPVDQQRALVLHDVAGLSVVEVAVELEVPEGTVRSWLSRGRPALEAQICGCMGRVSCLESRRSRCDRWGCSQWSSSQWGCSGTLRARPDHGQGSGAVEASRAILEIDISCRNT